MPPPICTVAAAKAEQRAARTAEDAVKLFIAFSQRQPAGSRAPALILLGAPGVGKGTYAKLLARMMQLEHINCGDLVRKYRPSSAFSGALLPDAEVAELMEKRLSASDASSRGFVLDGYPRTCAQASLLETQLCVPVASAMLLTLPETVLVAKCLGRRACAACSEGYNIADVYLPERNGAPAVALPALAPPRICPGSACDAMPAQLLGQLYPEAPPFSASSFLREYDTTCDLTQRADDIEESIIYERLNVFAQEGKAVETFYRERAKLYDFPLTAGISETTPHFMASIRDTLADVTSIE